MAVKGAKLGVADTTPQFTPGSIFEDKFGNAYMYLQADGAVTKELFYTYNETTWQIEDPIELNVHPSATANEPLCVSTIALGDNEYAWVIVGPHNGFTANAAEALDVGDVLYGHATGGKLADTASACFVPGVSVRTAIGSATTGTFVATNRMYAYDLP